MRLKEINIHRNNWVPLTQIFSCYKPLPTASKWSHSSSLILKEWSLDQQLGPHPQTCQKCRIMGPRPDLHIQNPRFYKIPLWFVDTLTCEKCCSNSHRVLFSWPDCFARLTPHTLSDARSPPRMATDFHGQSSMPYTMEGATCFPSFLHSFFVPCPPCLPPLYTLGHMSPSDNLNIQIHPTLPAWTSQECPVSLVCNF